MKRLIFLLGIICALFSQHAQGQNCNIDFESPAPTRYIIEDNPDVFYTATSTGVVTKIDILHRVGNTFIVNDYLEAVNPGTGEVSFKPTDRLATEYLDLPKDNANNYRLPDFDVYVKYTCDDGNTVEPSAYVLLLSVIDVNNRNPTFDAPSYRYKLPVPIKGTPFNWDKPIRVFDKDLLREYNTLTFKSSNPLVLITYERFETPYGDLERQRLDYYNLYLRLADNFDETAPLDPVTITASDGTHDNTVDVEIIFQKIDPYIKILDFNQIPLKNEPGLIDIATISADHIAILEGNLAAAYDVSLTPIFGINEQKAATISLELKRPLMTEELGPNAEVKLTLKVENADKAKSVTQNLVLLYEITAANRFQNSHYRIDIASTDEVSTRVELKENVRATYRIDPPPPSYLTFNTATGEIRCKLSKEELLANPGVDVFTVTAELETSEPQTTIVIYKHAPVITFDEPLYEKVLNVAEFGTIPIGWKSDVSDVVLTVEPSNSCLTIDLDGVTLHYDVDQAELETRLGVDIFVVTATAQTGGASARTTVAIWKNPPVVKIEKPVVPPVIVTNPPGPDREIYQVLLLTPQPPNVQFSIKPHGIPTPHDYLTIDNNGKIFCDLTQEEIEANPGMDSFIITVSSAIVGGSSAEMGLTVFKNAPEIPAIAIQEPYYNYELREEVAPDFVLQRVTLKNDLAGVKYEITGYNTGTDYLSIDSNGRITCALTQAELVANPGVDIFNITAFKPIGVESSESVMVVYKNPPNPDFPVTCPPSTECPPVITCPPPFTESSCPPAGECPICPSPTPEPPTYPPETDQPTTESPTTPPVTDSPTCPPITEPPTTPPVTEPPDSSDCPTCFKVKMAFSVCMEVGGPDT